VELLGQAGFAAADAFPPADSPAAVLRQHVLLASAPGDEAGASADLAPTAEDAVERRSARVSGKESREESEFERRFATAVGNERDEVVIDCVRECVMEILHSDPDRPPARDARLMELGVDSLMAVRLGKLLTTRLGLAEPLPSTLIFDYPTIHRIAELVRSRIEGGGEGARGPDPESVGGRADAERERELAELSDAEVEAMLLERLEGEESS
jgi:acyl carrier protein